MESGKGLGRVHVITGPGKGKTTAAFGLALRAAGHGLKVCVIQFLKTGMTSGEVVALERIDEIQVHQFGTGKFVNPKELTEDDRKRSSDALAFARRLLTGDDCDLLILDEVTAFTRSCPSNRACT
jgi:cob(I)alamin adenosyltransferase